MTITTITAMVTVLISSPFKRSYILFYNNISFDVGIFKKKKIKNMFGPKLTGLIPMNNSKQRHTKKKWIFHDNKHVELLSTIKLDIALINLVKTKGTNGPFLYFVVFFFFRFLFLFVVFFVFFVLLLLFGRLYEFTERSLVRCVSISILWHGIKTPLLFFFSFEKPYTFFSLYF